MPPVFSPSISLAVPAEKLHLLGFLAVLASIWMGASLSLLAIVNERTVLDHERLLFFRLFPYVTAKTSVLWLFSAIQTIIFTLLLSVFAACRTTRRCCVSRGWVAFYLTLVGWAAVGVGW